MNQILDDGEAFSLGLASESVEQAQPTRALVALALAGVALLYLLGIEQGSTFAGLTDSHIVHEFLHDARHIAAFPCH